VKAAFLLCEGSTFFSGADIGEFGRPAKRGRVPAPVNQFEALPFPVVAAMHGPSWRRARDRACVPLPCSRAGTRFGLPEVTLGIIPGAGGTSACRDP